MSTPDEQPLDWTPRAAPLGAPAAPVSYLPPVGAPPARRRRTGLYLAAGAIALVLIAAAVLALTLRGGKPASAPAVAVTSIGGTFTLTGGVMNLDDVHCQGGLGYDDIREGAQVTVTDEAGKVIAVGQLGAGVLDPGPGLFAHCVFTVSVDNVPAGHTFYGVSVSHRGAIQVPATQVGSVQLSLGG